MSAHRSLALTVVLGCAVLAGCAAPDSVGGYFSARRHDLIDVVHVDFSVMNFGAVAYAAPFTVGLDYLSGFKAREPASVLQIGLGGPRIEETSGLAGGLLMLQVQWDGQRPFIGPRPRPRPSGFAVGANVGLFLGVGAEADVLEVLDFIAGLFCLDMLGDDEFGPGDTSEPITPVSPPPTEPVPDAEPNPPPLLK